MTVVSHEREPGEVGFVARYAKTVKDLEAAVRADPGALRSDPREAVAWAFVSSEMLRLHVRRRDLLDRMVKDRMPVCCLRRPATQGASRWISAGRIFDS